MAADPSEHEKAVPVRAARLTQIERAVSRTRASHTGQPFEATRQALTEVLRDEGAERAVPQVVEELARQISEAASGPRGLRAERSAAQQGRTG
ncbi:hypothetical protein B591_14208 [Streptomyces sp. GBA 94-10 4N24]|uniref:hypothetical protein n=1 Tax=Streptomyces sp. GBA 94-10 4N24 TaxID=1218177 RepID=UPI0003C31610|nr:hypothetical protein [Streptomyces sp. GBA 94-10 4N24]ESP99316.1 hypothetical protein B591_14208 [Streptomyces sp. GBA 94-10 4N24]UZN59824.1 hypothetical protein B591N_14208 [Streptomyces sp. GBA 94-10 4N24]